MKCILILKNAIIILKLHCVKSVQIRSFFWSVLSRIQAEYGDLQSQSSYSVRIRENTDQKKFRIWTLFKQCYVLSFS